MKKILERGELNQFINTLNLLVSETRRYSSELWNRYRITAPQLAVLRVLKTSGDLRLSDLSERINLTNSTVTGIIDRLEHNKLVTRRRSLDDRRAILVSLTLRGREMADQVPAPHLELIRDAFQDLPWEDRVQLLHLIRKFHQSLIKLLSNRAQAHKEG